MTEMGHGVGAASSSKRERSAPTTFQRDTGTAYMIVFADHVTMKPILGMNEPEHMFSSPSQQST